MTDNLLLSNQLCFALYSATNSIVKIYRAKLEGIGLTYPQYLVMITLWENGDLTVSSIAKKLRLDTPTITPILKRLENNQFVSRMRSAEDERVVIISLTKTGKALEPIVAEIQNQVACSTGLSEPDFIKLRDSLHELVDTMEKSYQENIAKTA